MSSAGTARGAIRDSAELQAAFALFNKVSGELTDSYRQLERRVEELSSELQQVDRARLAELEAREQLSERLRSLLDLLPAGVVVLDHSGRVVDANPAAREMLGLGALIGERWVEVIRRTIAPRHDDGHEISLASGRRVSVATRSLERDSGQLVLLTDQTEARELLDRLSRHQRLTAMGRMMAALAHQIRTPLSAALLYASNLADADLPPAQVRKFSARIRERLTHLERQVRDMLGFVRGEVQPGAEGSVGELVAAVQASLDGALAATPARCELSVRCARELRLRLNIDALAGAVQNLVDNALQAGGPACPVSVVFSVRGERLYVEVFDRGPGMSVEVLRQVGEDFFTTRSQGTGLGIAVARSVAQAHGGGFEIRSVPGEGTSAALWLPIASQLTAEGGLANA
jgi:two-component system sensor histidine kinase FlrB